MKDLYDHPQLNFIFDHFYGKTQSNTDEADGSRQRSDTIISSNPRAMTVQPTKLSQQPKEEDENLDDDNEGSGAQNVRDTKAMDVSMR